jgi:hypothetical protein
VGPAATIDGELEVVAERELEAIGPDVVVSGDVGGKVNFRRPLLAALVER